jgi:hypothetical protein
MSMLLPSVLCVPPRLLGRREKHEPFDFYISHLLNPMEFEKHESI